MSGMMQELQGPCMPYCLCSQCAALRAHGHPMHQLPPHGTAAALPAPQPAATPSAAATLWCCSQV